MKFIYKHIHLIIFTFISIHFGANANTPIIPNVNLLESNKKYFEKLPVFNQGSLNTCYSYTASTMVDYYRLSHGESITSKKDLSSPLWLASNYKSNSPLSSSVFKLFNENQHPLYDVGTAAFAINQANSTGHCTFSKSDSAMTELLNNIEKMTGEKFDSMSFFHFISKLLNDIDAEIKIATTDKNYVIPKFINWLPEYMSDRVYSSNASNNSNQKKECPSPNSSAKPVPTSFELIQDIVSKTQNTGLDRPSNYVFQTILNDIRKSRSHRPNNEIFNELYKPYIAEPDATRVAPSSSEKLIEYNLIKEIAFENVIERYIHNANYIHNPNKRKAFQNFVAFVWEYHFKFGKLENDIYRMLQGCKNNKLKTTIPDANWTILAGKNNSTTMQKISYSLTKKNPQPLELVFCYGVLISDEETYSSSTTSCSHHSALVVGQREKSGKTQLLIQNSYGTSCSMYSKKWECVEGQGAVWIDAEQILNKSIFMSWL